MVLAIIVLDGWSMKNFRMEKVLACGRKKLARS